MGTLFPEISGTGIPADVRAVPTGGRHIVLGAEINNLALDHPYSNQVRREAKDLLGRRLADEVINNTTGTIREERGAYRTAIKLDVYVLTADQLHELVQMKAKELHELLNAWDGKAPRF